MEKELALSIIQHLGLDFVDDVLRADKDLVLAGVRRAGRDLSLADAVLRADKDVVVAAVGQDPYALEFADAAMRADEEVVMAAVGQNLHTLRLADPALRANRQIIMALVRQETRMLAYADEVLRRDKDVVMEAVTHSGHALEFAVDSLRADKEIVMAAVARNGHALRHAHASLQADVEVVYAALAQDAKEPEWRPDQRCNVLWNAHKGLLADINFVAGVFRAFPHCDFSNIQFFNTTFLSGSSCCFAVDRFDYGWGEDHIILQRLLAQCAKCGSLDTQYVIDYGVLLDASTSSPVTSDDDLFQFASGRINELQLILQTQCA